MDRDTTLSELERLRARIDQLEAELSSAEHFTPPRYYLAYHALAGFVLGIFGALASLVFNIVGSLLVGQHPLQLIRVYLTFPLGEPALHVDDGLTLAVGCTLYLFTGMMLGIPFHVVLTRFVPEASIGKRLAVVSLLAVALWLFNFYGVLSWLQPLLFQGNWIVREIPWWVAALTHLVFGWSMVLVQPLGRFLPQREA
jgi:hypothetical protein